MNDDDKAQDWCSNKLPCARYEAQAVEIERLREALNDAAEVIESCSAVFLREWGTTNKWRNAVLAKALAALAGKAEQ
jgi:hypothetical protein